MKIDWYAYMRRDGNGIAKSLWKAYWLNRGYLIHPHPQYWDIIPNRRRDKPTTNR